MKQIAAIYNPAIKEIVGGSSAGTTDGGTSMAIVFASIYRTVVLVGGLALLLYLAWGGVNWVMSSGDPDKVKEAKNRITHAIVGMGILVAVIAIVLLIQEALNFNILNPTIPEPGGS